MRFQLCILSIVLFIAGAAVAQSTKPASPLAVDVWPAGKMPGTATTQPETERPPGRDNVRAVTNVSRPTLTVFPAPSGDAAAPAMIVCPGGGYSLLAMDLEGTEIAAWLNTQGITAAVLKYRVPRNREGAFQDVQRALSLARARASEWNIDPQKLGVIGFSAGGNLAAKASGLFDQRAYPAMDAVDQQSCRPDFAVLVYPAYLEQNGTIASDLNLKAKIPPTLIIQTEDDRSYVNSGKVYHAALDEAKIPNEFHLYPTGGHGYALRSKDSVRVWPQVAAEWFHKIGVR
jgi:acetyl esterase/lipase